MTLKNRLHNIWNRRSAVVALGGLFVFSIACGDSESDDKTEDGSQTILEGSSDAEAPDDSDTSQPPSSDASFDSGRANGSNRDAAEETCGSSPFESSRRPVNILLVIDKSDSMEETPTGFDTDKWSAMKSALGTVLDASQEDISFGLELFPMPDGCDMPNGTDLNVAVQPTEQSVPEILQALDETTPSGGTPTAQALQRALEYFTDGAGADLEGVNYVLLATDGGPNCSSEQSCDASSCTQNLEGTCPDGVSNCCDPDIAGPGAEIGCLDEEGALERIEALEEQGIITFIVGIPGSEDYASTLDNLATSSGAVNPDAPPQYFAVMASGGLDGLTAVFSEITTELITTCELQLESEPPDLGKLNVEVEGTTVPRGGEDGWELDVSTDPPTVVLQGQTCETMETEGVQSVQVVYGCPTVIIE